MTPKWTILIATLGQRADRFTHLLDILLPQVEAYRGDVRILAYWNNFERPLGAIRQALVEAATGGYVNFIDDDDEVPAYYCAEIHPLLDGEVHYIGWRMQLYVDGRATKPTFHSLRYPTWHDDEDGYYRNVSHLNPVRRDLALRADFRASDGAEDVSWAQQMTPHLTAERFIDRPMYFYRSAPADSCWDRGGTGVATDGAHVRPVIDSAFFSYHPDSSRGA